MGRDRISKVVVEVVTIVGSILLALALDAWWDDRRERIELREALIGLEADIVQSRSDLLFLDSLNLAVGTTAEGVLALLQDGSEVTSVSLPVGSLVTLIRAPTFDPPLGEVDALLSSAQLSDIEDADFRRALAAWPAAIADLDEFSQVHVAFLYEQFIPFLRTTVPLGPMVEARYGPAPDESVEVPASSELVGFLQTIRLFVVRTDTKLQSRIWPTLELIERGLADAG